MEITGFMVVIEVTLFLGLGVLVGSFGVVQIIILLKYSIPTNKKLRNAGFLSDYRSVNRSDKMSVLMLTAVFIGISMLVHRYATYNSWMTYLGSMGVVLLQGRKQLGANSNNISDYVKSHNQYFVNHTLLSEDKNKEFAQILEGKSKKEKKSVRGFLLIYVFAVLFWAYRIIIMIFNTLDVLTDQQSILYLISVHRATIVVAMVSLIMYGIVLAIAVMLFVDIIKRSSTIRIAVMRFHVLVVLASVVSMILMGLIPVAIAETMELFIVEILVSIIFAAWGISYFKHSIRVQNTFNFDVIDERYIKTHGKMKPKGFGTPEIAMKESNTGQTTLYFRTLEEKAEEVNAENVEVQRRKKYAKIFSIGLIIVLTGSLVVVAFISTTQYGQYRHAKILYQNAQYSRANPIFNELEDYKDASLYKVWSTYQWGVEEYNAGNFEDALVLFSSADSYGNSSEYLENISAALGVAYLNQKDYENAILHFEKITVFKQSDYVRGKINEAYVEYCEALLNDNKYENAKMVLENKLFRISQNDILYSRVRIIEKELQNYDIEQKYAEGVVEFNRGSYWTALEKFKDITGFNDNLDYDFSAITNYRDAKKYLVLLTVIDLFYEYEHKDVMESYVLTTRNGLRNLYNAAKEISYFENTRYYLDSTIFYPIYLEGRFTSGDYYFEYRRKDKYDTEVRYNIPWYNGKYFRLIENATIMQNGDMDNWVDVFGFSFDEPKNVLFVYSYRNGRTYRLNRSF